MNQKRAMQIAAVLREPYPADADFIPYFRSEGFRMPEVDPQKENAEDTHDFYERHRAPDARGLTDGVTVLPNAVAVHERDADGNSTRLVLRPPENPRGAQP